MIGRIILTRIEPCFAANKKASGEASRVKKEDVQKQHKSVSQSSSQWERDTFTASGKTKTSSEKNDNNIENNDKYTHKGN